MNKYDALFIRAIKSHSPEFRLRRLYCKVYYHVVSDHHLTQVLSKIVDDYKLMSHKDYIDGLNPANKWMYGIPEHATYYQQCVAVFSSCIRLARVDTFDDYPVPAKWRNKQ